MGVICRFDAKTTSYSKEQKKSTFHIQSYPYVNGAYLKALKFSLIS